MSSKRRLNHCYVWKQEAIIHHAVLKHFRVIFVNKIQCILIMLCASICLSFIVRTNPAYMPLWVNVTCCKSLMATCNMPKYIQRWDSMKYLQLLTRANFPQPHAHPTYCTFFVSLFRGEGDKETEKGQVRFFGRGHPLSVSTSIKIFQQRTNVYFGSPLEVVQKLEIRKGNYRVFSTGNGRGE